jgi:hypothetical protein
MWGFEGLLGVGCVVLKVYWVWDVGF